MAKGKTQDGRDVPPAEDPIEGCDVATVLSRVRLDDHFISGLTIADIIRLAAMRISRMRPQLPDGTIGDHDPLAFALHQVMELATGITSEDLPAVPVVVGIPTMTEPPLPINEGLIQQLPIGVGAILQGVDVTPPSCIDPHVMRAMGHGDERKSHDVTAAEMRQIESQGRRATPGQLAAFEARTERERLAALASKGESLATAMTGAR